MLITYIVCALTTFIGVELRRRNNKEKFIEYYSYAGHWIGVMPFVNIMSAFVVVLMIGLEIAYKHRNKK